MPRDENPCLHGYHLAGKFGYPAGLKQRYFCRWGTKIWNNGMHPSTSQEDVDRDELASRMRPDPLCPRRTGN